MVAYPGATLRADRLRPLNRPKPIRVEADERGYPVAVGVRGHLNGVAVAEILDRWRIDDEWWRPAVHADGSIGRAEVSRLYFHVALRNRQLLVIFRDLIDGVWYAQTTATPLQQPEPVDVLTPRVPAIAAPATAEPSAKLTPPAIRRIGVA